MPRERDEPALAAAETVARQGYGRLVAFLAARTGDVAAAEDAVAEAFATALETWPSRGIPDNPTAWLVAVAQRKAVDQARRRRRGEGAADHLRLIAAELAAAAEEVRLPDDRLALMFACAHPALDPGIRAPLILQTVLGFDAAAVAAAFLVAPSTMGQRLVRAKTRIRLAGIPFRVPEAAELPERLDAVLEAIYAAFAEGWTDPAGTEARQRNLADEAIWLGRLVAALLPDQAEALGLLALMLYSEARRPARRDARGDYVPLQEQDTARWDATAIQEAEALLARAGAMGRIGRFQLEAAIQSAHVVRHRSGRSDWPAIACLYDALAAITDSPVVAINRAVAIAEIRGAGAGLAVLDALAGDARLAEYQPYWAARAGLLMRAGEIAAAKLAYRRAIGLETDPAVRTFLQRRQASCTDLDQVSPRTNM